jgi:succinate dehydrogenase / fumarate reductase, membrane anchor subunit
MSAPSITTGARTVRRIKPMPEARNRFERGMWLFMRYSGLILVFLVLSHFWFQHLVIGTHALQANDTVLRWGQTGKPVTIENVFWRVYYMLILGLSMAHGLNGLRQVAYDYLNSKGIYRATMLAASALIGAVSLLGFIALFAGATVVTKGS